MDLPDPRLQLFSRLLQSAPLILWAADKTGQYTMLEGRAAEALGAQNGWAGRNVLEDMKGTDAEEPLRRAFAGEESRRTLTLTEPVVTGTRYYDAWYLPVRDDQGQPNGMYGIALDVTAEREREAELTAKLTQLSLLVKAVNSAPVLLWIMEPAGKILLSEGGALPKIGLNPGEAVGLNALEMFRGTPTEDAVRRTLGGEDTLFAAETAPGVYLDSWVIRMGSGDDLAVVGLSIDASERVRKEQELSDKLELIQRQAATIRALATPIIRIWDEVLCLPVIGTVDSQRTADMMSALLGAIMRERARFAIVDLTGVEVVDTSTADHLIRLFKAARVLGVEGVLCGIQPAVAQTVVALGMELGEVRTKRTLQDALRWCMVRRAAEDESAGRPTGVGGAGGGTVRHRIGG